VKAEVIRFHSTNKDAQCYADLAGKLEAGRLDLFVFIGLGFGHLLISILMFSRNINVKS